MEISALYLPQFHQIPENDEWWGEGFTEWTNVRKALPLFQGHKQPVIPGQLGYYSLLSDATRVNQAELAQKYGVTSFCYWHYWFGNGKMLLERPLEEVLMTGEPDFPFYVGWANSTWAGHWYGESDDVLIEQTYPGAEDHKNHFDYLLQFFNDSRYLRIDGKPVLLIHNPKGIPDKKSFIEAWQKFANDAGFPGLYIIAWIQGKSGFVQYRNHHDDGFSAGVYVNSPVKRNLLTFLRGILRNCSLSLGPLRYKYAKNLPKSFRKIKGIVHQSVQPNWDNTPRSGRRGMVITNTDPEKFERMLSEAIKIEKNNSNPFLLIKSWNEWAEGNYIEPDETYGEEWLASIKRAKDFLHD